MLSSSTIKQQAIPPFHNYTDFSSHLRIISEVDKHSNKTKLYLYSMLSKNKIVITPDVPKTISEFKDANIGVGMVFAIVGTSWCGKSTIANVARQLFGPKYGRSEKAVFADLIRGSIVKSFSQLLTCLRNFLDQDDFVKEHHRAIHDRLIELKIYKLKKSLQTPNFTSSGCEPRGLHSEYEAQKSTIIATPIGKEEFEQLKRELIQHFSDRNDTINQSLDIHSDINRVVKLLEGLWNDSIVQIVYALNHRIPNLNVATNLEYWIPRLRKIFSASFSPKSKDILQSHPGHNGIYAHHPMECKFPKAQTETVTEFPLFEAKEIPFVVLDVSDMSRKLEHVIDLVTDVVFVVSMDDYYLVDERNLDRLSDAIQKFRTLCEDMRESFLTRRIPLKNITLVFNKFDIFSNKASQSEDLFTKLETSHPDIYTYYGTGSGTSQQLIRSLIDYFVNIYDSYFKDIREFPISKQQIETYRLTSNLLAGTILNICVTSATNKSNMEDFWRFVIGREKGVEQRSYCTDGSWIPFRMCRSSLHEQYGISYLNWGENFFVHGNNQPFRFAVHENLLLMRCPELSKIIIGLMSNEKKAVNTYEPVPTIMLDLDVGILAELIRRIYDGFGVFDLHKFVHDYPSLLNVAIKKPKKPTKKPKLLRSVIQKYKFIKAKTINKGIIFRFNHPQFNDVVSYVDLIGSNLSALSGRHDMRLFHQNDNISSYKFMLSMRLPGFTLEKDYYVLVPYIKKSSYFNVLRILNHERDVNITDWKELIEMIFISKMWQYEDDSILVETLRKMFKNVVSTDNVDQMIPLLSNDYIDFSQLDDPIQGMVSERTLLDNLPTEILYVISSFLYGVFDTNPQNSLIDQDYLSLICCLSHTSFFRFFKEIPKDKLKQFIWKTKFTKFTLFLKECNSFQEKHK